MALKLRLWVGACWLTIVLSAVVRGGAGVYTFALIFGVYYNVFAPFVLVPIFALLFAGWFWLSVLRLSYTTVQLKLAEQAGHPLFERRLAMIEGMLARLCAIQNKPVPNVVFLEGYSTPERLQIGMMDFAFQNDVLVLHGDSVGLLTERQLYSVLAHETRHSNSPENKLRPIFSAIMLALVVAVLASIPLFALTAVFSSSYSMMDSYEAICAVLFPWAYCQIVGTVGAIAASRATEYKTDALACNDVGNYDALASSLSRISELAINSHPSIARLHKHPILKRLSTHPTNERREKWLRWAFS